MKLMLLILFAMGTILLTGAGEKLSDPKARVVAEFLGYLLYAAMIPVGVLMGWTLAYAVTALTICLCLSISVRMLMK